MFLKGLLACSEDMHDSSSCRYKRPPSYVSVFQSTGVGIHFSPVCSSCCVLHQPVRCAAETFDYTVPVVSIQSVASPTKKQNTRGEVPEEHLEMPFAGPDVQWDEAA